MATLRLEGIEKSFGRKKVLKDINLEIGEDVFTAILGRGGSGKTTLMQIITGILRPDKGKVYLGDRDLTNVPPRHRRIAMISQGYNLYPNLTVFENIGSPLRAERRPEEEVRQRVVKQAEILKIDHLLEKHPYELSGGEAQRTALGRALVRDADIYLLDEPLTGLDYKLREGMTHELKEILSYEHLHHINLLYATPNYQEALAMAEKTILMSEGEVLWYGDTLSGYRMPPNVDFATHFYSPPMNLFSSSLKDIGGRLFLYVSDEIKLPVDHLKSDLKEQEYVLGLHTHAFNFEKEQATMPVTFSLTLADVTPAGTVLHMELDGQKINGYFPFPKDFNRGEIQLFVKPDDFHIFEKKSGTLIMKYRGR
jgi:ABC-type sugar transport system ATPase subunit